MADDNEEDYSEPTTGGGAPVPSGPLYGAFGQVVPGPTVTTTGPSSSTTRVNPTAGYMQSIEDQKAAAAAETQAIDDSARNAADSAFKQKLLYDNELQNEETRIKARADAVANWNTRIGDAQKKLNERIEQASAEPTSYWADRTEGEKTAARIGVWLSAFGAAITGGDNLALKSINESIERDLKVKQAKSERLFKLAEQSRGLLSDAYRQKAEELGDMDAQRAAAWQTVAKQMESVKMGFLPAEKRAEADQKIAQVNQKAAQALQDANKNLETKITSESGHVTTTLPATGTEKPATLYDPETGAPMGVTSSGAAKDLNSKAEAAQKYIDALNAYKESENTLWGRTAPAGEAAHTREQLAKQVIVAAKSYYGNSVGKGLGKETQELISETSGADASPHWRNKTEEIEREIAKVQGNLRTSFRAKGAAAAVPRAQGHENKPAQSQAKQAGSAADDYSFIVRKLDKDEDALDPTRLAAFKEAIEELRKPNGDKAKAARVLKYIRNELPKD